MTRSSQSQQIQQQIIHIEALLHNINSIQLNSHLYANSHHISPIVAKGENGRWTVSKQFPQTVLDFVMLERPNMLALQKFYNIPSSSALSASQESRICGVDNLLFIEIARRFGLAFWLKD